LILEVDGRWVFGKFDDERKGGLNDTYREA